METITDPIMDDTTTTANYPSVSKRPLRGDTRSETLDASDKRSLKKAKTTALPHSPSSPFSEILHVGLRQVQQRSKEESATDYDFASAVNAGRQFQREERYDDAILSFRKALLCKNKSIAMESPSVQLTFASTLFEVGMIHSYSQYHDPLKALQAFQAFELCLQMSRACLGEDHPSIARVLYEIGVINESMSDPEEALAHFSEAIAILLSNSMDTHLKTLWMSLSRVQALLGQTEDAESSFNEFEKL
jgi:tetratricopeptide (TPR) repeat protein